MITAAPDGAPIVSGAFHTFRWLCAPAGLATRRQLTARGLRPGRQPIAGEIVWRRGRRVAYLYRADRAQPKRPATPAQLAALDLAMRVRRTCPSCGRDVGYCLPRRWPACLDCQDRDTGPSALPSAAPLACRPPALPGRGGPPASPHTTCLGEDRS